MVDQFPFRVGQKHAAGRSYSPTGSMLWGMVSVCVIQACAPVQANSGADPSGSPGPVSACAASTGQEIMEAVNVARSAEGHPPLVPDLLLVAAARAHSRDMASRDELGHQGRDGSEVHHRAEAQGYAWLRIAENVASGQPTVGTVMDSWLRSPGHRRNILDPGVVHLGVGLERSSSGRTYWTQVFGAPDGDTSLPGGGCHP